MGLGIQIVLQDNTRINIQAPLMGIGGNALAHLITLLSSGCMAERASFDEPEYWLWFTEWAKNYDDSFCPTIRELVGCVMAEGKLVNPDAASQDGWMQRERMIEIARRLLYSKPRPLPGPDDSLLNDEAVEIDLKGWLYTLEAKTPQQAFLRLTLV